MLLLIPVQVVVFMVSPPPETVEGFFRLYQENWFLGIMSLDLLYILNNVIILFIYLALFLKLYKEKPALCLTALVLGIVGVACYFPTNPAFEILTLSNKYTVASAEYQSQLIAAGEALLTGYTGTSFDVYYVLNAIVLLLFSWILLKSPQFKKSIGTWGIIAGIFMIIPSTAGTVGLIFSLASLVPWIVFLILFVKNFLQFSKMQ